MSSTAKEPSSSMHSMEFVPQSSLFISRNLPPCKSAVVVVEFLNGGSGGNGCCCCCIVGCLQPVTGSQH